HADGTHKKHHALHSPPIQRIRIARNDRPEKKRNPRHDDVETQKNCDEKSAHHLAGILLCKNGSGSSSFLFPAYCGAVAAFSVVPFKAPLRMRNCLSPAASSSEISNTVCVPICAEE